MKERATAARDVAVPPPAVDVSKPSVARVYDHALGGKEHFESDRAAIAAAYAVEPELDQSAHDNRNLLRRAIRYLVSEAGVRQVIDLGSGLPTDSNLHEMAHTVDSDVRVVYVDNDPLVLAHGRALLSDDVTTTMVAGDLRNTPALFDDPELNRLVDLDRPFAVIAAAVLHHLGDGEARAAAAAIRDRLGSGCYLLVTHFLNDDELRAVRLEQASLDAGTYRFRTWAEQREYFDGLEMVEPGLVYANEWRPDRLTPDDSPVHTLLAAGLGIKP